METTQRYGLLAIRILLTLAFLAAGTFKLIGDASMVAVFDAVGLGQWFRYVTGAIEIAGAVLLWVSGRQAIGAALLTVTMIGAVGAHLLVLGPSAIPALVLGVLAAILLWHHRHQLIGNHQPA